VKLAETLGVTPTLLFLKDVQEPPPPPCSDDVRIEAALLRTRRQIRGADVRAALGLSQREWDSVIAHPNTLCLITAREGILSSREVIKLNQPQRAITELTRPQARVLRRIINGTTSVYEVTQNATLADR
jgi:hypothetical protein